MITAPYSSKEIVIGTRIHCILYGGRDGQVVEIRGSQSPSSVRGLFGGAIVTGGNAEFDAIWDDGTESRRVPECIVRGVQWKLLDEPIVTQEGIELARANARMETKRRGEAQAARAAAFSAKAQAFRVDPAFAHLSQEKGIYSWKLAAKNIRADLKKYFAGVKFSVRSSHDSIDIRFRAGSTTRAAVKAITDKFVTGYYDSLSDCHLSQDSPFNVVFGGVEHIWAQEA